METDEMLVLACSKKWGGRCVAGISRQTGDWLRPVSKRPHRELSSRQYRLDGRNVEPLDIVRFEYGDNLDDPAQPENVEVGQLPWQLAGRVDPTEASEVLSHHMVDGPELLGNRGAAVPEEEAALGMEASLALVRPEQVEFSLEPPRPGEIRSRPRVRFTLNGQSYDLALTDYLVAPRLTRAGIGSHELADLGLPVDSDVLLTVSLAEPQNGWCAKLAAAVLILPEVS